MKIYATSARKRPEVPIVPLMDILVILLIFFVVTTTFREKKNLLPVDLPKAGSLAAKDDTTDRVALTVTPDLEIFLGEDPFDLETLAQGLRDLKTADPDVKLELKADSTIPLGFLVSIWDALTEGGFEIKDAPARILLEKE